jgi:hypothetical protein
VHVVCRFSHGTDGETNGITGDDVWISTYANRFTARQTVNMTISLAFLAPDLVKAAIDGRLPYGMGIARLTDLPAEWSKQREMLGFPSH